MFFDIQTIAHKEILEIRSSGMKLLTLLLFLSPSIILVLSSGEKSIFPINLSILIALFLTAVLSSGYITLDTIMGEKRSKMLDILLASGISKFSIIIGKAIPSCNISTMLTLLSLFIMKLGLSDAKFDVNILIIISLFLASYFSACTTVAFTILIGDEKLTPVVGSVGLIGVIALFGYILNKLNINFDIKGSIIILIVLFSFSILITIIAAYLLKKISIISKI